MSAKTSNQPGRRTPLSLSGVVTKGGQSHNNKGGNSANNANGHNNNLKQDNKSQSNSKTEQQQTNSQKQHQTSDVKENPTKVQNKQAASSTESKIPKAQHHQNSDNTKSQKQGNQNDKKQQLAMDKQQQQNGVSNNNTSSGNQQQQNNKEKQQNENDIKSNEKDNKKLETSQEKPLNDEKEKNKTQEKPERDEKKHKSEKKKQELKKDEENSKEDNIEIQDKTEEKKSENVNKTANATGTESIEKGNEKDNEKQIVDQMDVVEVVAPPQQEQLQKQDNPKSAPSTPKSLKESKPPTPNKATPNKTEKTPQKCTATKREVTTCIDDFEMEPLNVENSPSKADPKEKKVVGLEPCATSTPGKIILPKPLAKTDVQLAMQPSITPERPRAFSQISGRRAIRSTTEYTPSKFQCNPQFRESYRRINTELDATNTSLNVTVGSEIPNNASFSFFGRGRKRERTPPQQSQSDIGELQTTGMEISPPKRARLDFFSVVSSPLSLLRNRFSKATLQSSTPVKLQQKLVETEDDIEVQNVSGVSVHEDIEKSAEEASECGDASFAAEVAADNIPIEEELEILDNGDKELSQKSADKQISDYDDIKITETALQPVTGDPTAKNKRCIVM